MQLRRLGLVAATHGHFHEHAIATLRRAQVDLILHAGDMGGHQIVQQLEELAPVIAVSATQDDASPRRLPQDLRLHLGGRRVFLCHGYDPDAAADAEYRRVIEEWSPDLVVYGRAQRAVIQRRGSTLLLSPGRAGAVEPGEPCSVATVGLATLDARIWSLGVAAG